MTSNDKDLVEKPEKPLDSDCCGGGACCPCVWDTYFEQLERWQEQQRQAERKDKNQ